jgi:hypothetical protein
MDAQTLAKATLAVWRRATKNSFPLRQLFFFQKKKQKALFCFAEEWGCPNFGEADPGGLGAGPQNSIGYF